MMSGVLTYAIIPARGGSKGIPRKNLQTVAGSPLIVRTVRAALGASSIDRVYVTTDDDEIAEVARAAGAEIVLRPTDLAGDTASSESALLHALTAIAELGVGEPDAVVMLQCTSPFTTPADIDGTTSLLGPDAADSAFTAAATHSFLWRRDARGAQAVNHDAAMRPRRQDREQEFVETGAVYAMATPGFLERGHRFFGRTDLFEVPTERALEIDTPADLALANAIAATGLPAPGWASPSRQAPRPFPSPVTGLALDFDGVLTDNRVMTFQDGNEAVVSDRADGLGIEMLRNAGLPMVVLSKERHPVVAARCRKLRLDCEQGIDDKVTAFRTWITAQGLDPAGVLFVGNDVNDVECLNSAGYAVVVADAQPAARNVADLVLSRPGGRGAVRELADLILQAKRS
jgi:YrbI family 3-deoxy-D-manno-octulosonate 8-phosphate phosphatase